MILRSIVIAALAFSAGVNAAELSASQPSGAPLDGCCEPYRYVYAESWYGAEKVVAPVRHGPLGDDEVLLPGDIWVACELSCEYALRKQTLDYWQKQGAASNIQVPPAYPRQDSYVDQWGYRHGYPF
jgi:hypothetical protein